MSETSGMTVGFSFPEREDQSGLKMSGFQVISSVYYILS